MTDEVRLIINKLNDRLDQAYSDAVNDAQNYWNPRVAQDALQNAYNNVSCWIDEILNDVEEAKDEEIYSADAEPVKHGKWEHDKWGQDICMNCGKSLENLFEGEFYYDREELHFCPNCGAKMDGDIK